MQDYPPTVIYRHRRENLKKCSLTGLENRPDFQFFSYPTQTLPNLKGYILLDMDAPVLTSDDAGRGLCVFDATWRYAEVMIKQSKSSLNGVLRRSLPKHYRTAYPRKQEDCSDPEIGLASVEALFVAYHIMGRETEGLLDHYYWKEKFIVLNNFVNC
ncbi:MAG: hypothetical protein K940chlam3_01175 [Chlamydiae bacterium]|nr:hypothetical protein [Chlamydiota bacterium]